jgi:tetratricopeptide (TPR) repeat protein
MRCYLSSYSKEVVDLSADKITKKQLKKDSFITTMLKAWEYSREHQTTIFVVFLIVVVAIVGVLWTMQSRREAADRLANRFGEALSYFRAGQLMAAEETFKLVREQGGSSRDAVYSKYFIGKCKLEDRRNLEAIEAVEDYLASANKYDFFYDAAMAGKAVALENERRFEEAALIFVELAKSAKTTGLGKKNHLISAAENFKKSNQKKKALEVMEELLEFTEGIEKRDLEVEISLLEG